MLIQASFNICPSAKFLSKLNEEKIRNASHVGVDVTEAIAKQCMEETAHLPFSGLVASQKSNHIL